MGSIHWHTCWGVLALALVVPAGAPAAAQPFTVATFADPSPGGESPLFTVDLVNNQIFSEWTDAETGLDLQVPGADTPMTYQDAFFTLTDTSMPPNPWVTVGANDTTGPGVISYFADGEDPDSVEPLVRIEFSSALLTPGAIAADELLSMNVVMIDGRALPDTSSWTERSFGFALANHQLLNPGDPGEGFTATASFSSSAVPEPSALTLLVAGVTMVLRRRRRRR